LFSILLVVVVAGCTTAKTDAPQTALTNPPASTESVESEGTGTPDQGAPDISIAILPFGGLWTGDQSQVIAEQLAEVAKETIESDQRFVLRYSYYAHSADNEISISSAERIWEGVRPNNYLNDASLYSVAQSYNLDAVILYKVELGPWRQSDFAWVDVECRAFDIKKKSRISTQGELGRSMEITEDCLKQLISN
jgi:hypothetical protein